MVILQNKSKASAKIIGRLRSSKEKILSKEAVFKVMGEYERVYKKKINRISLWTYFRKSRYIRRIMGDYYYVYSLEERHSRYCQCSEEELVFLVLEKMKIRWYLGLERALIENKISWQVLGITPIINNHFSGIKRFGNSKFKFIKTGRRMFKFGLLEKKTNNKVSFLYSDPEKTYLDFLYFCSYEGKDIAAIRKNLDFSANKKIMAGYACNYSKKIGRMYGIC